MASSQRVIRILAFGASLTEGYYAEGILFHPYTNHLAQLFKASLTPVEILNAGVSGDAILGDTMLPRLQKHLSKAKLSNKPFDWVLILAGTNDTMRDQQTAECVYRGYQILLQQCNQHGARVLAMTLPETIYPTGSAMDKERQDFNRFIREKLPTEYSNENLIVLDVESLLPRHSLTLEKCAEIWDDGVHLTPKGYDRLAELIHAKLKSFL